MVVAVCLIGMTIVSFLAFIFLTAPRRASRGSEIKFDKLKFAHRGMYNNTDVPENSLAAFKIAVEKGYAIELDIRLTKDNEIVVFHDDSLKRMCQIEEAVSSLTLNELRKLYLSGTKEQIPTFKEFLKLVDGKVPLLIEYKAGMPGSNASTICTLAEALLSKYSGSYFVESFNYNVLEWYKLNKPEIMRGQLSMGLQCYVPAIGKAAAEKIPLRRRKMMTYLLYNYKSRPNFIGYRWQDINFMVKLNKLLGAKIACWTVTSKETEEKLLQKYDSVIFEQYLS
ncbi:MAG: hypothetical protein JEZ04_13705 [Spirochaetales bacterium]|nr:hypothetical protein [Spirochaetales bacterium]